MADQWLNIYHQNLSNQPPLISDHEINNSGMVSDSTVVTAAVSSAATPPASGGPSLSPDGRVGKPVRKRSRASRRTPTTLLNTDAANFRAMVQQFTGGPASNNNHVSNFTFGFPGSSHPAVYDPPAAANYHLPAPPQLFQHQNLQPPPFMFSMGNSPVSEAALFQTHGGSGNNNNVADYMGLLDGPSPPPPRHHHPRPS